MKAVGDNPDSAAQMGIDVKRIRIATYMYMGLGAALAGVFSTMINFTGGGARVMATCFRRSHRSSWAARLPGAASARSPAARLAP